MQNRFGAGPPSSGSPVLNALQAARAAYGARRWVDLQAACRRVLTADPGNAEALHLMGRGALETGALAQAIDLLEQAAARAPRRPDFLASLGQALLASNRPLDAKAAAQRALPLPGTGVGTLDTLGVILNQTQANALAVEAFRRALDLQPGAAGIWYNLGWTEQHLGHLKAAADAFRRATECDARHFRALAALVEVERQTTANNHLPALERLFEADARDVDRRLHLGHALAKSHEDLGDPAAAYDWLVRAKAGKRKAAGYDHARSAELFAAAAETFSGPAVGPVGSAAESPILVLGLPRSGTTLVDRILSSHPEVASTGEPTTFPLLVRKKVGAPPSPWLSAEIMRRARALDPAQLGRDYLDSTSPLADAPRFLDKTPVNFLFAGLIHRALPNARIVCLRRDPMDSILSVFRHRFGERTQYDFAYSLEDTARYYVLFDRLMAHWRAVLPANRFREVRYEDVISDIEVQARGLLAFAGLDWTPAVLDFHRNTAPVSSASSAQVRSPLYTTSVGRWRAYGDRLNGARAILAEAGLL